MTSRTSRFDLASIVVIADIIARRYHTAMHAIAATTTLWRREMVRFARSPFRVIGALGTPVLFWLMLGSGADKVFVPSDMPTEVGTPGYMQYFFPGAVVMIVLFTAIFSVFSVIEDRREGFLQGVLASPAPRGAIVLGKVLGGATLATAQGAILVALWPMIGPFQGWAALAQVVVAMFVTGAALTAMALALAWPMRSTAGFHSVMNLLLLPMWFLCGAVFPLATAPPWMRAVMRVNPLTYGYDWISGALHQTPHAAAAAVTLAFAAAMLVLAAAVAGRPTPA